MSDVNWVGYIPEERANFIFTNTLNGTTGADIDNDWKHKNDAQ